MFTLTFRAYSKQAEADTKLVQNSPPPPQLLHGVQINGKNSDSQSNIRTYAVLWLIFVACLGTTRTSIANIKTGVRRHRIMDRPNHMSYRAL